jgi:hypothetical protein
MQLERLTLLRSSNFFDMVEVNQLVTIPALLSPVFTPIFGSFITTYLSWIWILWINRYYLLSTFYFTGFRLENLAKFDGIGFLLFTGWLAALLYGIDCICSFDVTYTEPFYYIVASLACGALFLWYNRKRRGAPIIDFSILAKPKFKNTLFGAALIRIGFSALPFLLPAMFQSCFNFSALHAALLIVPLAMGALLMKLFARRLLARVGYKHCLCHGGIALAFCMLLLTSISDQTPLFWNGSIMFLAGLVGSLLLSCTNYLAYYDFQASRLNHATSLVHTAMHLSTSLGIALSVVIVQAIAIAHSVDASQTLSPSFLHWTIAVMSLFPIAGAAIFSQLQLASPHKSLLAGH